MVFIRWLHRVEQYRKVNQCCIARNLSDKVSPRKDCKNNGEIGMFVELLIIVSFKLYKHASLKKTNGWVEI